MITALALVLSQVGVPMKPMAELKEITIEVGYLTFDRKIDWAKVPAKKIETKETDPALPSKILVFNGQLKSLADAPYELSGDKPGWKVVSRPMIRTLMGHKAATSTASAIQVGVTPNAKDSTQLDVEISYDPAPRKATETRPYPFVRTVTMSLSQSVALTFSPAEKQFETSVQMIGIQIAPTPTSRR